MFSEKESIAINDRLINEILRKEIDRVNTQLPVFKRITDFIVRENEFEKTTTQKIKRYADSNVE